MATERVLLRSHQRDQSGNVRRGNRWKLVAHPAVAPYQTASGTATASFAITIGTGPALQVGDQFFLTLGDEDLPTYILTAPDIADTSLVTLHYNLQAWLQGMALFKLDYIASQDYSRFDIASVSRSYPAVITTTADTDWATGNFVSLENMVGMPGSTSMGSLCSSIKSLRLLLEISAIGR